MTNRTTRRKMALWGRSNGTRRASGFGGDVAKWVAAERPWHFVAASSFACALLIAVLAPANARAQGKQSTQSNQSTQGNPTAGANDAAENDQQAVDAAEAFGGGEAFGGKGFGDDNFDAANELFGNVSLGDLGSTPQADSQPATFSAQYFADNDGTGLLRVTAEIDDQWHVYSTTQATGPEPTRINLIGPAEAKVTGEFKPDRQPKASVSEIFDGATVEEHTGVVVWSAPLKVPNGYEGEVEVQIKALVCEESTGDLPGRCMPFEETLIATYGGTVEVASQLTSQSNSQAAAIVTDEFGKSFRDADYVVQWRAAVKPKDLAAGERGVLQFTARPDESYHVYKSVTDDSESSTNFVVTEKDGLRIGPPVATKPFVTKTILPGLPPVSYYKGPVSWQLPIEVPADAKPGKKTIEGFVAYQACTDTSCLRPVALKFVATVVVGDQLGNTPAAIELAKAKSADALDAAAETDWVDDIALETEDGDDPNQIGQSGGVAEPSTAQSFPILLGLAFIGGFILNFMPCVLPVVGLKVMGFVSQAGEDRRRVLLLNLAYILGIMAVFAILAVIAAVSTFGWGEQFTYFPVRLGLTLLLFALALSYLGVWEIPAPGMAAGKKSQDLQSREGLTGAFSKGIFATILATPCSGPLLGYILGLTLSFTPLQTILIFLTVGLGMSSPYLLIGLRPSLVQRLPKPGPWMETLKQAMAFLFLGTVAFFFAQFDEEQKLPVFVSLIAVWFGCWIIGLVPDWAELYKRLIAWGSGIAAATIISVWSFNALIERPDLNWITYSESQLQQLNRGGKTVLVDFGAKWCASCIYNYEVAIDTEETREVVEQLDAVAMYADYTDYDDNIKAKLEELQSRSIPLLAIYPGDRPGKPILLRDVVTQQQVINALKEAGASTAGAASSGTVNVESQPKAAASIASTEG